MATISTTSSIERHVVFYTFDEYDEYAPLTCHFRKIGDQIEARTFDRWFPICSERAADVYAKAAIPPLRRTVCVLDTTEPHRFIDDESTFTFDLDPKVIDDRKFTTATRLDIPTPGEMAWGLLSG